MKRILIIFSALLVFTMVASEGLAQQGRGNGRGRGSANGNSQGNSLRSGQQNGRGNGGARSQSGNQDFRQSQLGSQGRVSSGAISSNNNRLDWSRMREEEKLARDIYTSLAKTSGLSIFRNIARAENQHMQAVERLMGNANGNAMNDVPGSFAFPDYQQLYQSLVASGSRSPLDALKVGARIEEMDIADLRQVMNQTNDPRAQQVLGHLMQGSQNHLRAFASQISNQGGTYNAVFLSQAEFDQIAQSSGRGQGQQSGGRGANGAGQGASNQGRGQQNRFQGRNPMGQGFGGSNQKGQTGGGINRSGQGFGGQRFGGQGGGNQSGGGMGRGKQGRGR